MERVRITEQVETPLDPLTEARKGKPPAKFMKSFYVIDGHAMIHRAYHAPMVDLSCECPECDGQGKRVIPPLKDKYTCATCNGTGREPTKATYGFTKALIKLCREHKPTYLAFTVDCPRDRLHRRKIHPEYKANRPESEWEIGVQIQRVKQIVKALDIPVIGCDGYEADDVIATLVDAVGGLSHVETLVVSRDKDLTQLIGPGVRMYDALKEEFLDGRWVLEKFGVHPQQMGDYLAMVGDSTDNYKGVPGIGEGGAKEILTKHLTVKRCLDWTVDDLFNKGPSNREWPRPIQLLIKGKKEFELCKKLVTLDKEVPLEGFGFEDLVFKGLDLKKAAPIFRRLGFRRWQE
jgi:DNA polymerase-1